MASKFLPVIIKNAILENTLLAPKLLSGPPSVKRVLAFCGNYRMAAIGSLLLTGRSQHFFLFLPQSGRAFAHFLTHAEALSPRLSQCAPFFDAVGAGDFEGAADIARRSRRTWAQGEEYEEDFLFPYFLMQHFFLDAPATACESLLARYEQALQGAEDLRLEVCRALLAGDSDAFNAALTQYLCEHKDVLDKRSRESVVPEEEKAAGMNVSIEGLALVRLAERKGLETEEEYLLIPSIAREAPRAAVAPEAWMQPSLETLPPQSRPKKMPS